MTYCPNLILLVLLSHHQLGLVEFSSSLFLVPIVKNFMCWQLYFLWEDNSAPERHTRPLKKIQILSTKTKKTGICTLKACIVPVQDTKSTQPASNVHPVWLLKTTHCQIDGRVDLPYKKGKVNMFCFFCFFDFFQANTVYIVQQRFCQLAPKFKRPPCDPF